MTDIGRHQFQPVPGRDRCADCYQPAAHSIHAVAEVVTDCACGTVAAVLAGEVKAGSV